MDCNQESQAGFSHNCACHVSKQTVSALGFSSVPPPLQTAIGLEILFWLMFPTFSFLIIHQEEVLKNLDCSVGLQASHPYLSIWKHLISILHFQNMLNPNCWHKHWEYGSLPGGEPNNCKQHPKSTNTSDCWVTMEIAIGRISMAYKLMQSGSCRLP